MLSSGTDLGLYSKLNSISAQNSKHFLSLDLYPAESPWFHLSIRPGFSLQADGRFTNQVFEMFFTLSPSFEAWGATDTLMGTSLAFLLRLSRQVGET